jgi:flagellar basal-body rod protein FlgF
MDRMLYVAMNGARETMLAQATTSNNLANASTTGFKADLQQFRSQSVFGPGHPSRAYAMTERPATDFTPGPMVKTDRDLDVAIEGQGFIAMQSPEGKEVYGRSGNLRIDANGRLLTATGHPVLGNNGPIVLPEASKVDIGKDGWISIIPAGQGPDAIAVVDRIRLVKPPIKSIEKGEDGFIRLKAGEPAGLVAPDASVTLISGMLESSNVNPLDSLVEMINHGRKYELQVKMMKTADDTGRSTDALLRLN